MAGNTTIDQGHKKIMRYFEEMGGSCTKSIVSADVLCVGDGPLVKSGSLLLAISTGKVIVTEQWLLDSTRKSRFLEPSRYLPEDPDREREWGFNLADAIERGRKGLTHLLSGSTVYLTKRLQEAVTPTVAKELSKLATVLGADEVKKSAPSKSAAKNANNLDTLVVLGLEGDPDISKLADVKIAVYSKDLLTMAALRGKLDWWKFALSLTVKEEREC
ncbi:uncharacterized protein HMPREF1541_02613 [Cyphellophora europaea CBS 101466]|uniref:BRCT domain-containing protein n=1 Tax=Cyphellophora europaea (strain CBS 101466) TaxID=1220924 RepID=W2S6B0_CYPE1|nr:uncharacterized protein HMPREF1541_02613 [Cyphellophora europaea CBS 101466]ETN43454.1 hypothetical protein HMPREF1541_02613 [Cyphellophora europaea CBS 101466]